MSDHEWSSFRMVGTCKGFPIAQAPYGVKECEVISKQAGKGGLTATPIRSLKLVLQNELNRARTA